jgi:hypothetical protein
MPDAGFLQFSGGLVMSHCRISWLDSGQVRCYHAHMLSKRFFSFSAIWTTDAVNAGEVRAA